MTEKRFTIQGVGISDHERKRLYDLKTVDGFISIRDLLNALHEENKRLKKELSDASKLLDGLTIPELLEFVKQYSELNIHFSKIKNTFVDEKGRLIGVEYDD